MNITRFDYYFNHAPEPTKEYIDIQRAHDKAVNPCNDSYKPKLRTEMEIILDFKKLYALEAMKIGDKYIS